MEPLSEFVRKAVEARQENRGEEGPLKSESPTAGNLAAVAEFPTEPFACPACGQLLAPSCRVCVACKHVIDPAEIVRGQAPAPAESPQPKREIVRFSWPLFFVVFGVSCILVVVFQGLWTDQQKVLLAMGGLQTLAGVWVFFDALRKGIPKPLRWSIGSMLLPLVIFPWYLARRRRPHASVPVLEGGPVIRLVILALLLFFLANLIFYVIQGPPPATNPTPPTKQQKTGGSQAGLYRLPPWKGLMGAQWAGGTLRVRAVKCRAHGETSAPSDAWHT